MRLLVLVPAVLVCLGCPKPAPDQPKVKTSIEGAPKNSEATAPTVSAKGVGAITSTSAVSQDGLEAAFPGYEVKTATRTAEGDTVTVFELHRAGQLSMTVEPTSEGKVYRVSIVDADATSPAGISVGASYEQLAAALQKHECFRLVEDAADSVACYGADLSSVGYVLGDAAKGQKPGAVPSKAVLSKAKVTEILWLPETE